MTDRNKLLRSALAAPFIALTLFPNPQAHGAPTSLTVYAGPQSVSPRQIINVTVEASGVEANVELSYISDGTLRNLTATTRHGLVSFDIPAQDMTGRMSFTAKTGDTLSTPALVTVLAGPPQPFMVQLQEGGETASIDIISDVITDKFKNPLSDLSLVSIDWIDQSGLKASQDTQLKQGRITFTTQCPSMFYSPIKLRASINSVQFTSADVSSLCHSDKG